MNRPLLHRRFGSKMWDGVLRGTGVIALLAIPASLLLPGAAMLAAFALVTVWVHGPISPLLPAAYEPTLMLYGRLYPPVVVAVVGTVANLYVEFLDYHMFRAMASLKAYRRLRQHPLFERATRAFARRPFLTTWLFAWTPLPDWMVRMLAPAAGYPVSRYLLAMGLGRLPRFWLIATLGAHLPIPWHVLLGVALGSILITALLLARRRRRAGATEAPTPIAQQLEAAPCGS